MRHEVGLLITDPHHIWFYIQQKDDEYHIPEYRGCYSLFGGTVEPGEDVHRALERALREELGSHVILNKRNTPTFRLGMLRFLIS